VPQDLNFQIIDFNGSSDQLPKDFRSLYKKMSNNNTLTIKREGNAFFYLRLVSYHFAQGSAEIRLEALGSAIQNLLQVVDLF
jgi:hypothetical protein